MKNNCKIITLSETMQNNCWSELPLQLAVGFGYLLAKEVIERYLTLSITLSMRGRFANAFLSVDFKTGILFK